MSKLEKRDDKLAIFDTSEIRRILVDEDWYYSVVDVIEAITESVKPRDYWNKLKKRELDNNVQLSTNCLQLKLKSSDGKKYLTDCADNEGILRIIQSVPSKKAEPFKAWLARIGKERLDEIEQPSKAIERAKGYYVAQGRSPEWVQTRLSGIDARHKFTDILKDHGINEGYQYAVLTNELYKSWSGFSANEYKEHKGIGKKGSLRDNMTPMELATALFSETAAKELIDTSDAEGFAETKTQIHIAGAITKEAVDKIESQTGKKVITHDNAKALNSPDIQKELVQQSIPRKLEKETPDLSEFNKNLKSALEPHSKDKSNT